jgi:hypothetical protein
VVVVAVYAWAVAVAVAEFDLFQTFQLLLAVQYLYQLAVVAVAEQVVEDQVAEVVVLILDHLLQQVVAVEQIGTVVVNQEVLAVAVLNQETLRVLEMIQQ